MSWASPNRRQFGDETWLTIRTGIVSDAPQLLKLFGEGLRESSFLVTSPAEFNLTVEDEIKWVEEHLSSANNLLLVAETGGELVGVLNFQSEIRRKLAHSGEFGMLVHADYRGRGIGRALLENLIEWAKNHPTIMRVSLKVFAENSIAINLYRSFGFVLEGTLMDAIRDESGSFHNELIMARWVKPALTK